MKKLLLLFVVLCTTVPSFAVTYNLNGGKYNPYDWASKQDMFEAFFIDGSGSVCPKTIADFQSMSTTDSADGITNLGLAKYITTDVAKQAYANEKWKWLYTYINNIRVEQDFPELAVTNLSTAQWRYETSAFFISGQSTATSWLVGASFAEAGKDENYFSAWGYNYGNPETVTEVTTLLNPYMDGAEFQGWYDNAEFAGDPVTTINAESTGTLYAKWDIVSYVTYELNDGVWNPYLWESKEDMLAAFLTDGGATEMKTIEYCQSLVSSTADGLISPGLCTDNTLSATAIENAFANTAKWGWLILLSDKTL